MSVQASSGNESAASIWEFDEFRLSPSGGLTRQGEIIMLEPRALEVLCHLVRHRHRVVSRDELLESVWGETVVEEGVLTQIICKLRRDLGDSARDSRFISTFHRRGYQFIQPLHGPDEPAPAVAAERPPVPAALALFAVASLLLTLTWLNRDDAPEALPILGFIPIEIESESPGSRLLGQTFDDLLFTRLSEQPGMITRTRRAPMPSSGPEEGALQAYAERQHTDWILRGAVRPALDPGRVWLEMELIKMTPSGRINVPIDRFELPLPGQSDDLDRLLEARHRVAQIVGERIGVAVSGAQRGPNDPSSLESMRLLLMGLEQLGQLRCGGQMAAAYLRQALDLDPQLTKAWVALGYAYYNEVWACGGDIAYLHEAKSMVERARGLEPLNELALSLETDLLTSLGRPRDALMTLTAALRERPDSAVLHFYSSFVLNYLGLLDRSEWHLDETLRLDPFALVTDVSDPPLVLLYRARWRDFLDHQVAVDSAYHRFYRGYALLQLGEEAQARSILAGFRNQDWQSAPFVAYGQALLDTLEGRHAEAIEKIERTHERRTANGIRDGEMTFKEAWLMSLAGDEAIALDYLELTIEQGFACSECIANSPFVGNRLRSTRFQALLEQVRSRELEWARRLASLQDPVQPLDP